MRGASKSDSDWLDELRLLEAGATPGVWWSEAQQDGDRDGGAPQAEGTVARGRLRRGFLELEFRTGLCAALHVSLC